MIEGRNEFGDRCRPEVRIDKSWESRIAGDIGPSLVVKLNGLDPEANLRDVLTRIADRPINRIVMLLPWHLTDHATIPRWLMLLEKKLDVLAEDCEPMLVSQIEGYLVGIIVCPDLITPSKWLPLIWDTNDGEGPVFQSARQVEKLMNLVMEDYNATIAGIGAGDYARVYDVDSRNDDVIWEMWIDGLEMAKQLRPKSWRAYLGMDQDTIAAIAGMLTLADIANGKSELNEKDIDELQLAAPDLIPGWVEILNTARFNQYAQSLPLTSLFAQSTKVGRNDPCPCDLGKKYKKCCGLN